MAEPSGCRRSRETALARAGDRASSQCAQTGDRMKRVSASAATRCTRRDDLDGGYQPTRRALVSVALAWSGVAWSWCAFAQPKPGPVLIGWLHLGSPEADSDQLPAFKEGLAALGYKGGQHYRITEHWGYSRRENMQRLAEELAAMKPRLIVAVFSDAVRSAVKAAPATPIVTVGGDPVLAGYAKSLARPGGMVTGLSNVVGELREKYLELLLAAVPAVRRVGVLHSGVNPSGPVLERSMAAARRSAAQRSAEVRFESAGKFEEIEPALSRLANQGAQGLVVFPNALFVAEAAPNARFALAHRLPLIGPAAFTRVDPGALLSYAASGAAAELRRAAYYVDRILRGAHPGDLPIQQPTKFELVLNMKTARTLGLTISQDFLLRVDRIIE